MFDINDWATLQIYSEYIIPLVLLLFYILIVLTKLVITKIKLLILHSKHTIERVPTSNMYWDVYKCTTCNKKIYEVPTNANTSFLPTDIDIKVSITDKCEKIKDENP